MRLDEDRFDDDEPEEVEECGHCGGEGGYERALVASRWDVDPPSEWVTCPVCDGVPFRIVPKRPDGPSEAEIQRSQSFLAMLLGGEMDDCSRS